MIQILHRTWKGPGPGASSYKSNNLEQNVTWKLEGQIKKLSQNEMSWPIIHEKLNVVDYR